MTDSYFTNHCGGCGKPIKSFAVNKQGDLPKVYCGGVCQTIHINRSPNDWTLVQDPGNPGKKIWKYKGKQEMSNPPWSNPNQRQDIIDRLAAKNW